MTDNPYSTLGIDKNATAEDVKDAYRKKARQAHPDAGGTSDEFGKVRTAYLVLSNPKRRAKFDADGDMGDDSPKESTHNLAIGYIMTTIIAVMRQWISGGGADPETFDLIAACRANVTNQLTEVTQKIDLSTKGAIKFRAVASRLKKRRNKKEKSMIEHALLAQASAVERDLETLTNIRRAHDLALEMLDDHEFMYQVQQRATMGARPGDLNSFTFQIG
jgi:curved DNA-binding protein CbpA